jgi:D-arginine dehydrogenase
VRRTADVVVIGGGIAGITAAAALAQRGLGVLLAEQEAQLAQHTTGRSAASFLESYGGPVVRALTRASRPRIDALAERDGVPPLLHPRSLLWVAGPDDVSLLERMTAEVSHLERLEAEEALVLCPVLRAEVTAGAALEPDAADIDVLALHDAERRRATEHGAVIRTGVPVAGGQRKGGGWMLDVSGDRWSAGHVVLAAGAWCDELAQRLGARPIGLQPLRRTIAICRSPVPVDPAWPLLSDMPHTWYCKPEGPHLLLSPADETPSQPCDARAEEEDVALGIERVNAATTLGLRSVVTAWAGLRTFAPDRVPVCGPDGDVPGLWWLAGQGGYGIQTAPAMAAAFAGLLTDGHLPADLVAEGIITADLAPTRLAVAAPTARRS